MERNELLTVLRLSSRLFHQLIKRRLELLAMCCPRAVIVRGIQAQRLTAERLGPKVSIREGHVDLRLDGTHAQAAEDRPQLVSALAAAVPAVGNEQRGLAGPLVEQVVDAILQLRGNAPVALSGEEDERILRRDALRPGACVLVVVAVETLHELRDHRLVKDGQVVLRDVDAV